MWFVSNFFIFSKYNRMASEFYNVKRVRENVRLLDFVIKLKLTIHIVYHRPGLQYSIHHVRSKTIFGRKKTVLKQKFLSQLMTLCFDALKRERRMRKGTNNTRKNGLHTLPLPLTALSAHFDHFLSHLNASLRDPLYARSLSRSPFPKAYTQLFFLIA